jgi:hypothetical protein
MTVGKNTTEERPPIKRGDKLIWRSKAGEFPVEAASNELDGIVVIRNQGIINQCRLEELFPDTTAGD